MSQPAVGTSLRMITHDHRLELHPDDPPLSLGRSAANDVATSNKLVSSVHAQVAFRDGQWRIEDVGSTNGTFVQGQAVSSYPIDGGSEVFLGDPQHGERIRFEPVVSDNQPTSLRDNEADTVYTGRRAHRHPSAHRRRTTVQRSQPNGPVVFGVHDLTVEDAGTRRLDRISFQLPAGEMLGVLGGSGTGKTTLVRAITGSGPATSGRVLFEGQDLYRNFARLRSRLGYVPQDDILHATLTVRETLHFAARLRMRECSPAERDARADEVMRELGISHRADARVAELSGGQRKRLNVAVELLSRPQLLLLDEPTSGLDPANERSLMQLLRELADGGRTVIVVTHSTESLHLVDDVLVLARGGVPVFFGEPVDFPAHYAQPDLVDAFAFVDAHPHPQDLRVDSGRVGSASQPMAPDTDDGFVTEPDRPTARAESVNLAGRDTWTLLQRSLRILRGDRRNTTLLLAQAPLIALLVVLVFNGDLLSLDPPQPQGATLLLVLILSVTFFGSTNTVREIVKERSIRLREQAIGVTTASYLASKLILWGAVNAFQASVIVLMVTVSNGGPDETLLGLGPVNETLWVVLLTGAASVASGLLLSSLVPSSDRAMTILPAYLLVQILLAGLVVPVHHWPLRPLSWLVTSKWGFDGVAAIADVNVMRAQECSVSPGDCSANWAHTASNLWLSLVALTILTSAVVAATYHSLNRTDPRRVLLRRAEDL